MRVSCHHLSKIYQKLKKVLEKQPNFEIPSVFHQKFKIFNELNNQDNLSYKTFKETYDKTIFLSNNSETSYDSDSDSDTSLAENL